MICSHANCTFPYLFRCCVVLSASLLLWPSQVHFRCQVLTVCNLSSTVECRFHRGKYSRFTKLHDWSIDLFFHITQLINRNNTNHMYHNPSAMPISLLCVMLKRKWTFSNKNSKKKTITYMSCVLSEVPCCGEYYFRTIFRFLDKHLRFFWSLHYFYWFAA